MKNLFCLVSTWLHITLLLGSFIRTQQAQLLRSEVNADALAQTDTDNDGADVAESATEEGSSRLQSQKPAHDDYWWGDEPKNAPAQHQSASVSSSYRSPAGAAAAAANDGQASSPDQRVGTRDPFRCGNTEHFQGMAHCSIDFATVECTLWGYEDCTKSGGCAAERPICLDSGTETSTNSEAAPKTRMWACCSRPSPSPSSLLQNEQLSTASFLEAGSFSEFTGKKCGSQLMSYVGDHSLTDCKRKCTSEVRHEAPYLCDAIRFRHQFVNDEGVAIGKCRLQYGFDEDSCEDAKNFVTFRKDESSEDS